MARFSRQQRLTNQEDFRKVWDSAYKVKSNQWIAFCRVNDNALGRIGIIIKKQTVNLALTRNMLRRIVRESFRAHSSKLIGFDIIILLRSKFTHLDKKTIRDGIDNLWCRVLANHSKLD